MLLGISFLPMLRCVTYNFESEKDIFSTFPLALSHLNTLSLRTPNAIQKSYIEVKKKKIVSIPYIQKAAWDEDGDESLRET